MDHDNVSSQPAIPAGPMSATETTPVPVKKSRSPVERAIVWGVILVGLAVLIVEGRASYSLSADRDGLLAAIDKSSTPVTESQAEKLVTRFSHRESQTGLKPNVLAAPRVDIYAYTGLLKQRILYVYYGLKRPGHEQEVIEVTETPIRFYSPAEFGIGPDGKPLPGKPNNVDAKNAAPTESEAKTDEPADSADAATTDETPETPEGGAPATEGKK